MHTGKMIEQGKAELTVKKTIDLFLDGQNQFLRKEIWVRPMSSSATSASG
jgi:hypothetical protein